jgi:hypothetical protein
MGAPPVCCTHHSTANAGLQSPTPYFCGNTGNYSFIQIKIFVLLNFEIDGNEDIRYYRNISRNALSIYEIAERSDCNGIQ